MKNKINIPVIFGINSLELSPQEIGFFSKVKPKGIILFNRNIESTEQLKILTSDIKKTLGQDTKIYIDQEGGRVVRITPPMFMQCPSAEELMSGLSDEGLYKTLGKVYENYTSITKELLALGIEVNCSPVADLRAVNAHAVIGHRSFGSKVETVFAACKTIMEAIETAGGEYIVKHIPGHGRAIVDSHEHLPIVTESLEELEATDFKVFKLLAEYGMKTAMTAHVVYTAIDPEKPVTLSKKAIEYIRNNIGFKGELIMDDINMKALLQNHANLGEIAKESIENGCDTVLHCNGNIEEMILIAKSLLGDMYEENFF